MCALQSSQVICLVSSARGSGSGDAFVECPCGPVDSRLHRREKFSADWIDSKNNTASRKLTTKGAMNTLNIARQPLAAASAYFGPRSSMEAQDHELLKKRLPRKGFMWWNKVCTRKSTM